MPQHPTASAPSPPPVCSQTSELLEAIYVEAGALNALMEEASCALPPPAAAAVAAEVLSYVADSGWTCPPDGQPRPASELLASAILADSDSVENITCLLLLQYDPAQSPGVNLCVRGGALRPGGCLRARARVGICAAGAVWRSGCGDAMRILRGASQARQRASRARRGRAAAGGVPVKSSCGPDYSQQAAGHARARRLPTHPRRGARLASRRRLRQRGVDPFCCAHKARGAAARRVEALGGTGREGGVCVCAPVRGHGGADCFFPARQRDGSGPLRDRRPGRPKLGRAFLFDSTHFDCAHVPPIRLSAQAHPSARPASSSPAQGPNDCGPIDIGRTRRSARPQDCSPSPRRATCCVRLWRRRLAPWWRPWRRTAEAAGGAEAQAGERWEGWRRRYAAALGLRAAVQQLGGLERRGRRLGAVQSSMRLRRYRSCECGFLRCELLFRVCLLVVVDEAED